MYMVNFLRNAPNYKDEDAYKCYELRDEILPEETVRRKEHHWYENRRVETKPSTHALIIACRSFDQRQLCFSEIQITHRSA